MTAWLLAVAVMVGFVAAIAAVMWVYERAHATREMGVSGPPETPGGDGVPAG